MGMLLFSFSTGLIGAAIIVMFGLAAFSALDTRSRTPRQSDVVSPAVAKFIGSDEFPYNGSAAAPIPAKPKSVTVDEAKTAPRSPTEPSPSDGTPTTEVGGLQRLTSRHRLATR
jgi:hypothetical protein